MKNPTKDSEAYISELEDKIIELSLKLKTQTNLLEINNIKNNELLGKLTHNLKNPIGTAFSFSEMMLEDIEIYTQDKLEKHLNIVKETSKYAINLINNFSVFQSISNSNCIYNLELTNYTELVLNTINNIANNTQKNIVFLTEGITKKTIKLNIDPVKITLALKQILENSVRFSNNNSEITVAITANKACVETTITDNGIGISEKDLKDVFKDFYTVTTYDLEKKKCIGLGLSLTQKIVKKHNGSISINSILNEGTTVKITLPNNI